jgi:hypothetical protein
MKLATGQDVYVMTPDMWNDYLYRFNALNNLPQPPALLQAIQQCQ